MKKFLALMTVTALAAGCLAGCSAEGVPGNVQAQVADQGDGNTLKIVTTIFPEYDWVTTVLGERAADAELTMLLDNGVDLHSYQPTVEDMMKISECDMFVYVGGESDAWVEDVLATAVNKDMEVIDLLDVLGDTVRAEEIVEGMEHEHDHEDEDHDHEHEEEMDEHVWLSLNNAGTICDALAASLGKIDAANADVYKANAEAYKVKLNELDLLYKDAVKNADTKTLLFGDRFPFRYLVDDYGLDYYAAFSGCSAEAEASFETIIFLSGKVDELGLTSIMTIEGNNNRIAETVRDNTKTKDQKILVLDSMQSISSADIANGKAYLSVMESNLEVLKEALSK